MVRSVVISILLGQHIIAYIQKKPEAGAELIKEIITGIDASKRIKLNRYQVKIVLGALGNNGKAGNKLWQQHFLAWDQYYVLDDDPAPISQSADSAVRSIVRRVSQAFLNHYYDWDLTL